MNYSFYKQTWLRILVLGLLVVVIAGLHYLVSYGMLYQHAFLRMLFYLPLILGSFWFGLKGSLGVCISVLIVYIPYWLTRWNNFSIDDFNRLLEGIEFNVLGILLGLLVEREKKRHRELLKAEKLAAIGTAVAEVAHDMKTPLMAIGGFASQVFRKMAPDDPNRKKLEIINKETARLESMVREMLDFGRPFELQASETDLNDLVKRTLEAVEPVARQQLVNLETELDPVLPVLMLDETRMTQVVTNLVTNAIQASPSGETVIIRTMRADGQVVLEIMDRGCGIKEEDCNMVFQPFFTTKSEGTGLGLAIVKKIIEAHGGEISWSPNPDKGVTFKTSLPV